MQMRTAKFRVGQIVRHRFFPFRGVIFDVDPIFTNTEEWYQAIPEEIRPSKDQPFYHLLAENAETEYIAYVSEQNLLAGRYRRAGAPPAGARPLRQFREGFLPEPRVRRTEGRRARAPCAGAASDRRVLADYCVVLVCC